MAGPVGAERQAEAVAADRSRRDGGGRRAAAGGRPAALLALQRQAGNVAVGSLVQRQQAGTAGEAAPPTEVELDLERTTGTPVANQRKLTRIAKQHRVLLDVRPTTSKAPALLAQGNLPKPEAIKAKSINDIDAAWLGFRTEDVGLVGYRMPSDPRLGEAGERLSRLDPGQRAAVIRRYEDRKREWEDLRPSMADLARPAAERSGKQHHHGFSRTVVTDAHGVVRIAEADGKLGAGFTGDHDVFMIRDARTGRQLTGRRYEAIVSVLRAAGVGVEHGAHMNWGASTKEEHISAAVVAKHLGDDQPEGGGEPTKGERLVTFGGPTTVLTDGRRLLSGVADRVDAAGRTTPIEGPVLSTEMAKRRALEQARAAATIAEHSEEAGKVKGLPALATTRTDVKRHGDELTTTTHRREGATWSHTVEHDDGAHVHTTTRKAGASVGDGYLIAGGYERSEDVHEHGGDPSPTTTGGKVGVTTDGRVAANLSTRTGNEETGTRATSGGASFDGKQLGASVEHGVTTASGRKANVGASATADDAGNRSLEVQGGVTAANGVGATVSVGGGHSVAADPPVEVEPGVWEVRYVVGESESIGGGASVGGVGVSAGRSSTASRPGARRFASEREAKDFQRKAALRLAAEPAIDPSTIAGALRIPVGEARGLGRSTTATVGASVTVGATAGRNASSTSAEELLVRRTGPSTVTVTFTVSATEAADWNLSGLGLTDAKGGSTTRLHEVSFAFDLSGEQGKAEFVALAQARRAPSRAPLSVRDRTDHEGHDEVGLVGDKTRWGKEHWKERTVAGGHVTEDHGGAQTYDAVPGLLGKYVFDEDEVHLRAQIVRTSKDGQELAARAELTVAGTSGAATRRELGKLVGDGAAPAGAGAKASGRWTLTAAVAVAAIRDLEQQGATLSVIKDPEARKQRYSEMVEENGANMLAGQVGVGARWDVKLDGDTNFPGEEGRRRHEQLVADLQEQLRRSKAAAPSVAKRVAAELPALERRRAAIADPKRYTDLPAPLRAQQLELVDAQLAQLRQLRGKALLLGGGQARDDELGALLGQIGQEAAAVSAVRRQIDRAWPAIRAVLDRDGRLRCNPDASPEEKETAREAATRLLRLAKLADAAFHGLDQPVLDAQEHLEVAAEPAAKVGAARALLGRLRDKRAGAAAVLARLDELANAVVFVADGDAKDGHDDFWMGRRPPG